MVDDLRARGVITSPRVAEAMAVTPRHLFCPDDAVAYVDEPVLLKRDGNAVISTISQPSMIALMLEQLDVAEGQAVLEVGTASGYNAALLSHLVGEAGRVVTVELEEDLARRAAATLRRLGLTNVEVVCGDGYRGAPQAAPFDRIIVTAGASDVSPAWREQVADGGLIVVPVTEGASEVCHTLQRRSGDLERLHSIPCGFVPLRRSAVSAPSMPRDPR